MAIHFNGNKNGIALKNLKCGDTFMYEGRLGLVANLLTWDNKELVDEEQIFFVDLATGRDFHTNSGDTLDYCDDVIPVEINAELV